MYWLWFEFSKFSVWSLSIWWIYSAKAISSPLSVFKCCLALLILSGKLKRKPCKSSIILMSQVLDLLRSEYWNGIELSAFKGLHICSACGADLCMVIPCHPTYSNPPKDWILALLCLPFLFFFPGEREEKKAFFFFCHTSAESCMLSDTNFMLMQAVWKVARWWQGTGIQSADVLFW